MKYLNIIVIAFVSISVLSSCRPSLWKKGAKVAESVIVAAKKSAPKTGEVVKLGEEATQKARSLAGKEIKLSEKTIYNLQYGDDVLRHVDFNKKPCPSCGGSGSDYYGDSCSRCDGTGYVYELSYK